MMPVPGSSGVAPLVGADAGAAGLAPLFARASLRWLPVPEPALVACAHAVPAKARVNAATAKRLVSMLASSA
jgi:hypothetical protein